MLEILIRRHCVLYILLNIVGFYAHEFYFLKKVWGIRSGLPCFYVPLTISLRSSILVFKCFILFFYIFKNSFLFQDSFVCSRFWSRDCFLFHYLFTSILFHKTNVRIRNDNLNSELSSNKGFLLYFLFYYLSLSSFLKPIVCGLNGSMNDLSVGRSVEEALRLVKAFQFALKLSKYLG